jgi:hypothetical protein
MLSKVCFEQEVARRAQESFEGSRRAETLRRLSKSKISEEIMQGVHRRQTYSSPKSQEDKLSEEQVETQSFGLATEGSEAKTFEHLQIFQSRENKEAQEEERKKSSYLVAGRSLDH